MDSAKVASALYDCRQDCVTVDIIVVHNNNINNNNNNNNTSISPTMLNNRKD